MQTEKQKHIEYLLERFFDGQTSNAEEQVLYSFFTGPELYRKHFDLIRLYSDILRQGSRMS